MPASAFSADRPLKLGTRGSPLALAQAEETKARLIDAFPDLAHTGHIEIVVFSTTGDQVQDRPLNEIGGKGLFTKELEVALMDGRADIAVHSLKDVGVVMPEGLELVAYLPREDVRDVLLTRDGGGLDSLPQGAILGTASLRRQALVKAQRPDLQVKLFRGSVQTRLKKLAEGQADATLLALAGLKRLGLEEQVPHSVMEPHSFLPAMAQGAIALQVRSDDGASRALAEALNDQATAQAVRAERACLAELDGSCRTPLAGWARPAGRPGWLKLTAFAGDPEGHQSFWAEHDMAMDRADAPEDLGRAVGLELRVKAGEAFFAALADHPGTWRA